MLGKQALEYIDEVLGEQLELKELTGSELQGLPLFLITLHPVSDAFIPLFWDFIHKGD